jgi:hypothetical protein
MSRATKARGGRAQTQSRARGGTAPAKENANANGKRDVSRVLDWEPEDSDSALVNEAVPNLQQMRWVHDDDYEKDEDDGEDVIEHDALVVAGAQRANRARSQRPPKIVCSQVQELLNGNALAFQDASNANLEVDPMTYTWVPPATGAEDTSSIRARAMRARPASRGPALNSSAPVAITAEEDEEKQHKRKQSNRESARRNRMRKQTEHEHLSGRVTALARENIKFRKEYETLRGVVDSLRAQNITLREELADIRSGKISSTSEK